MSLTFAKPELPNSLGHNDAPSQASAHWQMPEEQIGQQGLANSQAPLVFKFSQADPAGAAPWMSSLRVVNFSRMGATLATGLSGFTEKSQLRVWSSIVGLYSNIMNIMLGAKKSASAGALQLAAGEWEIDGEDKVQRIPGNVSFEAVDMLEGILNECFLPPKAVQIERRSKETLIRVKASSFERVQEFLHRKLEARQQAVSLLADKGKAIASSAQVKALDVNGASELVQKELMQIIKQEWGVPAFLTDDTPDKRKRIQIKPGYEDRFAEQSAKHSGASINSMSIKRKYESPSGIWEAILRPDKYPMQSGLIVGGILSNALRIFAGIQGDARSGRNPFYMNEELEAEEQKDVKQLQAVFKETFPNELKDKKTGKALGIEGELKWKKFTKNLPGKYLPNAHETEGSLISMIAYFIEAQREFREKKDEFAPVQAKNNDGTIGNAANKVNQVLNERPLLAAVPLKAWMLYNRYQDGVKTGDTYKKIGFGFDALSAVLTATMRKSDYGG